jgi:hypothetical protein
VHSFFLLGLSVERSLDVLVGGSMLKTLRESPGEISNLARSSAMVITVLWSDDAVTGL